MRRTDWKDHIRAQATSGKKVTEYCREQGLATSSFNYQKRILGEGFVEVGGTEQVEVRLSSGSTICVPMNQLKKVLTILEELK